MRDGVNGLIGKIKEWPLAVKIMVGVCIAAVIAAVILVVCIIRQGRDVGMESEASRVSETEIPSETQERVTETQEVVEPEVDESVPSFSICRIKTESLERNLDIYFNDKNDNPIAGVSFQVKLIPLDKEGKFSAKTESADKAKSSADQDGEGEAVQEETESAQPQEESSSPYAQLQKTADALQALMIKEEDYKKKMGSANFPLEKYERFLIKKKKAIDEYIPQIMQAPERLYTDEDKDGVIHVTDITGGTYGLCFIPVQNPRAAQAISITAGEEDSSQVREQEANILYDSGAYPIKVEVSSSAAYKVIERIMEKVEGNGSGDREEKHKDIKVEGKLKDTIQYTDAFSLAQKSDYTKVKVEPAKLGVAAVVSQELNEAKGNFAEGTQLQASANVKLFASAVEQAKEAELVCKKQGVSGVSLSFSENIAQLMSAQETEAGYRLSIVDPQKVSENVAGTLEISGMDEENKPVSVSASIELIGANTGLSDNGEELYVEKSKGKIVRATVGNYSPDAVYYISESSKVVTYHGFRKKGKSYYYYDQNSKPVKGKQRIGGVNYKFDEDSGKLLSASVGIDVSAFNGDIDWEKASCCVTSALVRCGYRGTDGKLAIDKKYLTNVRSAEENGIKTGMYFHSRAGSAAQAVEEASLAAALAKQAGGLTLPIYLELDQQVHGELSKEQRTKIAEAFCSTIRSGGYKAGVSGSVRTLEKGMDTASLGDVSLWVLQYNTECTFEGKYSLWQYTNKGHVPGIAGTVNLNKYKK